MTREPTPLGDGAYVQHDIDTLGNIVLTTGSPLVRDAKGVVTLTRREAAALLRWLDSEPVPS